MSDTNNASIPTELGGLTSLTFLELGKLKTLFAVALLVGLS
jgi:hypothetical protein